MRIKRLFPRVEKRYLPLEYEMHMGEDGLHYVQVYVNVGGARGRVRNLENLWSYGGKFEVERPDCKYIFVLKDEDRQILYALKSLNPQVRDDGTLVFEIQPSVLKFLRQKEGLQETEASAELKVLDEPVEPVARVDYDPKKGLFVQTGYRLDGGADPIPADQIKQTRDGKYVRIGNAFAPLKEISEQAKEFLK